MNLANSLLNNSSGTDYWGPRMWYLLHKITYNYPHSPSNETKSTYLKYFSTVVKIIPCSYCASHFNMAIQEKMLYSSLDNRILLIEWMKNQHNDVNSMNGKRIYQGFELDMLYDKTPFNHESFHQLLVYLTNVMIKGEIDRATFIYWVLMTYKIHPCAKCHQNANKVLSAFDISKSNWHDNTIIKKWINSLIYVNTSHV